jgi:hypothetical protein
VRVRPVSQVTCETKSIRPTRYLIVKDLGCSCRAEEETLTSLRPCQPLSRYSFERSCRASTRPSAPFRCGEVCFYSKPHTFVNYFLRFTFEKISSLVSAFRRSLAARGVSKRTRSLSSTVFFFSFQKTFAGRWRLVRRSLAARGVSRGTSPLRQPFSASAFKKLRRAFRQPGRSLAARGGSR